MKQQFHITGIGLVLLCLVLFLASSFNEKYKKRQIQNWAASRGLLIEEIQPKQGNGPFNYRDKAQDVYRARVRDKNNRKRWYWFKIDWMMDVKEE